MLDADRVRPREGAAGVVHAERHTGVDVLRAAHPFAQRKRALVDHLADDPWEHPDGGGLHARGVQAETLERLLAGLAGDLDEREGSMPHEGARHVSAAQVVSPGAGGSA